MSKLKMLLILLSLSAPCWSFDCYYTLMKDNCWSNYDVSVDVIDGIRGKKILTVDVPKGQQWTRAKFECEPKEVLSYKATYSPVFWESERGNTYSEKVSWSLPGTINPGDSAWNVSVCFSSDFAQVPMTPEATSDCKCDFSVIPIIPPKQT